MLQENKENQGVKYDADKDDWALMPFDALQPCLRVLMLGSKKYSDDNWKFVDNHERRYFNAAMRHLLAWKSGEKIDGETGITHLAHAVCCLLFLIWKERNI
jgi:hypothetical protein